MVVFGLTVLSYFDLDNPDQSNMCWKLDNLQPLEIDENRKKWKSVDNAFLVKLLNNSRGEVDEKISPKTRR